MRVKTNPDLVRDLLRTGISSPNPEIPFERGSYTDDEIEGHFSYLKEERLLHGTSERPGIEACFSQERLPVRHSITAISPFGRRLAHLMGDDELWKRAKQSVMGDDKTWSWEKVAQWLERESLK